MVTDFIELRTLIHILKPIKLSNVNENKIVMKNFNIFQSTSFEMNNERQPLLLSNENEQCAPPRPDVRSSPENVIVDGTEESKSPDDGN